MAACIHDGEVPVSLSWKNDRDALGAEDRPTEDPLSIGIAGQDTFGCDINSGRSHLLQAVHI